MLRKAPPPTQLNSSTILLAFVAILFGLGGTYAVRVYSQKPPVEEPVPPPPPKKPAMVTVPLASRDIPSGTRITLDDVALFKMTPEQMKKSISAKTFMTSPQQIIGKIAANNIQRGSTFDSKQFFPIGHRPGVVNRLQPGLRAITVKLTPQNALEGFAGPGQHVDVLFQYGASSAGGSGGDGSGTGGFYPQYYDFNPPRRRDYYGNTMGASSGSGRIDSVDEEMSNATITLVQDVEILALERQSVPTDDASDINTVDKISVLLAVNPRQAELLRVADGHGVLSLTMRGSEDEEQVPLMDPVTLNDIIDVDDVTHEMEVYRGTSRSTLSFSGGSVLNRRVTNRGPTNSDDVNRDASPATNPATAAPVFIPVWAPPALLPPSMTMPHAVGMPTQPPTSPAVGAETGDDATSGRAMSDSIRGGSATYHDATHEVLP